MQTRYFALIVGILYVVIGLLGFVPLFRQAPPMHAPEMAIATNYGYLFGLFPVNILHNLVHLAIGAWGVYAYREFFQAKTFARGLAIIYGVLAVIGLIPGINYLWGLLPLFGHDVWLHAVTAAIAAYYGYVLQEKPGNLGRSESKVVHG